MTLPQHILVIRLSAMGDVAMTVPVLRTFSKTYPDVKLTVVSRKLFEPLFADIPNINFLEADVYGKHKNFGLFKLANEAKEKGVDSVADLHDVLRSKVIRNYLRILGLNTAVIDKGRSEKSKLTAINENKELRSLKSTHERYAEVFKKLGYPLQLSTSAYLPKKELTPQLHEYIGKHSKKLIGIAPFAAYKSKEYPLVYLQEVIKELVATNKYKIVLLGAANEKDSLNKLNPGSPDISNIATLSFKEQLKLISNLDLMISMDSSNGHLAAMYGVDVITLWGVTHPYLGFKPYNQPDSHQIISNRAKYPLIPTSVYGNKYPQDYIDVMKSISPDLVLKKIEELV